MGDPGSITVARARTYAWWMLMRLAPYPRLRDLHARGRLRALDPLLRTGQLQVQGGLGNRLWLSAAHFEPWSAQAYGFLTGTHEPMVHEALRRSLPRGGVLYDVGANIGLSALIGARLAGAEGHVVAIDPQRENAEAIRANASLNGFANLTVLAAAAAARSGEAELVVVGDSLWTRLAAVGEHPEEVRRERVPTVALDDLDAPAPDVVKVDVEGAELEVLAGMRRLLAERRPVVIAEMHGKNADFVAAMTEAGYRVVNLEGTEPVEIGHGNVHAFCEPLAG